MLQKDPLTSLYNRTYFMEEANNRLQKRGKNQKLVFLDIDNFKTINDTYGHKVGDDVLISFSKRLIRAFSEHLIGRFGGDEFLLFITGLTKKKLMEKIEALNFVYKNNDIVIPIACSLGIIDVSGVSALTKDMIGRADFAMYESKKGK
jgi:diguanylate cyclase (GGDEF)-like protein